MIETQEVFMKRKWVIAVAVVAMLVGGAAMASAQFRMDIDIPWYLHVGLSPALEADLDAEFGTVDISKYAVIIPNIQMYYMLGGGLLNVGFGARIYTVLLINFLYPSIVGEIHLGQFDVNLNVGGLWGVLFGIGPTWETTDFARWFTADLSAGYRITDWFRIGVGAFAIGLTDYPKEFPYAVYVSGKFIVNPGKK
jgi:hypothetical protein